MAKNVVLTVQSPTGGINRRASYQTQAPFTAYDAQNFWPVDAKTGRITSATRPALTLFGTVQTECNMLSNVAGIRAAHPAKSFVAALAGQIYYWNGSTMVTATGAQAASVNTGKFVSAAPIVDELVICDDTLAPILFDYKDGTAATLVATAGTVPVAATMAANWQGAAWLAVDQILYASRVGDVHDWDNSVALSDLFGAFFTDGDYKGVIAGPITALMPQNSDVMLVGTVSGTMAMRGHPRQGGVFEPVGNQYPLGQGAWCQIPDGTILMLTPTGLMSLPATPNAIMAPISRERIPDELIALAYDRADPLVMMEYDVRWNGVHIYVRGVQEQAWWFDLNTGGFFRMEVGAYPLATTHFADFVTESTSGLLLGRYNGIYQYDRFGTETITTSLVAGPVKISADTMKASKIHNVRVTFARDTPNGVEGTFKVAAGIDGQDAVNRLLNGEEQYSIDLAKLEANNGMCYPAVVGHAAVFAFTTAAGDVAIEEVTVNLSQQGMLNMNRGTQISVDGEATEFTGAYVELDNEIWSGYSEATPEINPDENLPDYTHFVDLTLMPASWWAEVKGPEGQDIRVSDGDDAELPSALNDFDLTAQEGMLLFRATQPTTAQKIRVWVGNEEAQTPEVTTTYGQNNVFDDNWRGFWPDGGGLDDMTSGAAAATANFANGVSEDLVQFYGVEDGPMGGKSTDFAQGSTGSGTYWGIIDWATDAGLGSPFEQEQWSFIAAFRRTGAEFIADPLIRLNGSGGANDQVLAADENANRAFTRMTSAESGPGSDEAQSGFGAEPLSTWFHHAGVINSNASRSAYLDGILEGTATGDIDPPNLDDFYVGDSTGLSSTQGFIAMVQIHDTNRSDAWVKYQGEMMDQIAFWGTVGEFVLVNPQIDDTLNTTACPTGNESQTEVGTTAGYTLLTPTNPTDGSVSKFSHLIDLSILPSLWWAEVTSATGVDLRATDASNNFLPLDVIEIDTTAETGLAVVRKSQTKGSPQPIRLWAGNASAITIDPCNLYGQYTAYDSSWYGFWPAGSGGDRSQWQNPLTDTGVNATAGLSPVSSEGTDYVNTVGGTATQYSQATSLTSYPTANPISILASVKKPTGQIHTDSVIASLQASDDLAGVFLKTRPSSTPARTVVRNAFGTEGSAGYSGAITPTTQWFQAAVSFGNHTRLAYADALAGSSSSPQSTIIPNGLDTFTIGAEDASTMVRGMTATISLVSLHSTTRGSDWLKYWNKSLDQATFWTVGAWVADPTALS